MNSLNEEWNTMSREMGSSYRTRVRKPSITISLTLLGLLISMLVGMCTWGTMWNLGNKGLNAIAQESQRQVVSSIIAFLTEYLVGPIQAGTIAYQSMRFDMQAIYQRTAGNLDLALQSCVYNDSYMRQLFWHRANQLRSTISFGYASGDSIGFSVSSDQQSLHFFEGRSGVLFESIPDYWGDPVALVSSTSPYNATELPWYNPSRSPNVVFLSDTFISQTSSRAVLSFTLPLYRDLNPVALASRNLPINYAACAPQPVVACSSTAPRELLGNPLRSCVLAIDVDLTGLSVALDESLPSREACPNCQGWIFASRNGALIALANATITAVGPVFQVQNAVVQSSMRLLYSLAGINETDFGGYQMIPNVTDLEISVGGYGNFYLSSQQVPVSGGETWILCVALPRSYFYSSSDYATLVALVVVFLVIIPVCSGAAALVARQFVSKPSIWLAHCMDRLSKFTHCGEDLHEAQVMSSPIYEMHTMLQSFGALKTALVGFTKFAPVHVVRKMLAERVEAKLQVEETEATCFFSDIRGFTTIAEQEKPAALIKTLEEYFTSMTEIIVERQGIVGDFIGDAVFAFWNCPERVYRHAYLACDAAFEQQKRLKTMRVDWAARGLPPFHIRIGINSGPVLAGNVGSESRMKYTLMGDNVNLAARLEGVGKQYHVELVISDMTWRSVGVRESFVGRALDCIKVVGKKVPTIIWTLIARRNEATDVHLQIERVSERAMRAYIDGVLNDALTLYEILLGLLQSEDERYSCNMLIKRIHILQKEGLPQDWDGAVAMAENKSFLVKRGVRVFFVGMQSIRKSDYSNSSTSNNGEVIVGGPVSLYVSSRLQLPPSAELLFRVLSSNKKTVGSALSLLPYYHLDLQVVPVLLKLALSPEMKSHSHVLHAHLRRALVEGGWDDRDTLQSMVGQFDELQRFVDGKDKGQRWAAVWDLSYLACVLGSDTQGLASKVLLPLIRNDKDAFFQYLGLSSYHSLHRISTLTADQLQDPLRLATTCGDAVGARLALQLIWERSRDSNKGGVGASLDFMIQNEASSMNLKDPLAKVFFIKLCGISRSTAAMQAVATLALEDVNFRVVLEGVNILCQCNTWTRLKALCSPSVVPGLVAAIVSAFQCPRPVLHFSALRATAMLARCWAGECTSLPSGEIHPLNQLLTLAMVHLQNDSVYHRWRALRAVIWLSPPNNAQVTICERVGKELRSHEMSGDLIVTVFVEILLRCKNSPVDADVDWSMLLISSLRLWRSQAFDTLDPDVVLDFWECALAFDRCSVGELLADLVVFASGVNRSVLVERLERNIVYILGKYFARFASVSPSSRETALLTLKHFCLSGSQEVSFTSIECLGNVSLSVPETLRISITDFLRTHFGATHWVAQSQIEISSTASKDLAPAFESSHSVSSWEL